MKHVCLLCFHKCAQVNKGDHCGAAVAALVIQHTGETMYDGAD